VADAAPEPPADGAALAERARALSALFLEHPEIEHAQVTATAQAGRRATLDTRGGRVVEPVGEVTLRAIARGRAGDGVATVDHATWLVRRPEQLPGEAEMAAEVEALAARVAAWRALPVFEGEYIGPVLFEQGAAVDLFRHLLLPSLEGTPPPEKPPKGSRVIAIGSDEAQGSSALQIKRRVLPEGFTVTDDPAADLALPGAYAFDMEGEPAQAITLVRDGVVRTHYAARTPGPGASESNGHGRGGLSGLIRGVAAHTEVRAGGRARPKQLHKRALQIAASYDQDHYLIVRRLAEPDLSGHSGGAMFLYTLGDDAGPALPDPLVVYRVYADGREEPLRGASFDGADVRLLRDVVAAGEQRAASFLHSKGSRSGGLATTLSAPDVLISEAVLQAHSQDVERPPKLPSPLAAGGG